ncbi:hypothetical protein E1B28_013108 [Marasmius oreades]|uniref:Uncharacterized protein n=1 Tax=Marasmius oreades TaxID=181124 RepID=A0A9P7RP26_9AGAR|nr:uncharacterized protein E1B28_013108 [Marasmius oreades]KAG7087129.1 hypothetical protein E1B28_013108 [Marasmius oreades]
MGARHLDRKEHNMRVIGQLKGHLKFDWRHTNRYHTVNPPDDLAALNQGDDAVQNLHHQIDFLTRRTAMVDSGMAGLVPPD